MVLALKILLVIVVLSSFGFSDPSQNKTDEMHISILKFERSIDRIYQEINKKKTFNAKNCDEYILGISSFLLKKSSKVYLPLSQNDFERLKRRGDVIVTKLFLLRLRLRERLIKFYQQGSLTRECVQKIRMAFRYSRFIEEFITEILVAMDADHPKADSYNLSQHKRQFFLNPKYKKFQYKSGDIIVVRTFSFVSATIARIGDEDGQFSHAAMLYINDKGEKQVIEALNSKGVVITPFDEWRDNDRHARILLLRYRDEKLAKRSAQKLYSVVHRRLDHNNLILYDFKMIPGSDELFCSEVVQYAFHLGGEDRIPTFPTSFQTFSNHSFLDDLTIESTQAIAPSDFEIEPLVDLVAEWRNYDITRDVRIEDVVQTKVLNWMSYRDYRLKDTLQSELGASAGIVMRRYLGLSFNYISVNMPYGLIENIIKLYDVNRVLEKHLYKKEGEYLKKYHHTMDYLTMMNILEKFRTEDCERYINRKREMNERILFDFGDWKKPYTTPEPQLHPLFNTENELECNTPPRDTCKF